MQLVSIVGARPQFIKLAPIAAACHRAGTDHVVVHTGQHYDSNMSDVFFSELQIPEADRNLGIGSGTHGQQTGRILEGVEAVLAELSPDWVMVYGDTNSTLAGALAAVKLHLPVAHLEAGLRSFNRRMPEEHNRVLADHAADVLLAPSETALVNLEREGLGSRASHVGDVMVDVSLAVQASLSSSELAHASGLAGGGAFVLATIHRAENTDDPVRLGEIIRNLAHLDTPVLLAAHPRLRARAEAGGIELGSGSIQVIDPLPYRAMIAATVSATAIVTDSGGLQKEAYVLGTPCTTVRGETEWPETLHGGWNVLAADGGITSDLVLRDPHEPRTSPYGAGDAAKRVLDVLSR